MKKFLGRFPQTRRVRMTHLLLLSFLGFLVSACASPFRHSERETEMHESLPAGVINHLIRQIKQNGGDINKYFVSDDEGFPVVMAELEYENDLFEVRYDLESANLLEDSSYNVRFFLRKTDLETVYEDTLIWKPSSGNAGILLSMDDDYFESWEKYFDLFDKYNACITFFIIGENVNFSRKALNRGHDVGFHSISHRDLRGKSLTVLDAEVLKPVKSLRSRGIPVLSFAFPFGFSDPIIREILLQDFGILRGYGTTFRLYSDHEIRSGYIISKAIDNTVIKTDEKFYRLITAMLRTAVFLDDNMFLPLTTHDISDTASWGITPGRLEFLLNTAAGLNLKFYCYRDFAL